MKDRAPHEWDGREWQEYCEQLLILRHANSYARMPDRHGGDLGLEGYSTDDEAAGYQCYVPESQETAKRAADQRRKITTDLKKLVDKMDDVARELNGVRLRRWILVTPVHDSRQVTAHCRKKEREMRDFELPFLTEDFRIDVQTVETHFRRERQLLDVGGAGLVRAPAAQVSDEDLERLTEQRPELVTNLEEKIDRLLTGQPLANKARLRDLMQRHAVDLGNLEDHLRVHHPPIYEQYLRQRDQEEQQVLMESYTAIEPTSGAYVSTARLRFERRLREQVAGLRQGTEAERLSHGAVSDWLRRCPMDFIEAEGR